MIDIHSHILFGVDDGAVTIEDSIKLINDEAAKGVTHIILTPHFKNNISEINRDIVLENFNHLKDRVLSEGLKVQLYLGNEIFFDSNYCEVLENGNFFTLANSKYILIEFNLSYIPDNIPEMCYEAKIRGYHPIIAHIERYNIIYNNTELLKDILNEGAHLQVNASTVVNRESKESHKFANYLLKHELVSFVASDVHNFGLRAFYLDESYKQVKKSYGSAYADKIFYLNQQKILLNKYFDTPKMQSNGGRFLSKLFRNISKNN